jgi:hypothetical protein
MVGTDLSDYLERPATLREATWQFLLDGLSQPSPEALPAWMRQLGYQAKNGSSLAEIAKTVAESPATALVALDVVGKPELLESTAIALERNGVECVITRSAAEALARSDDVIVIDELGTGRRYAVDRVQLIEAMMRSEVFDQLQPPD